jgi:hypothetical protein
MGVGEHKLLASPDNAFSVHACHQPRADKPKVSVNRGFAIRTPEGVTKIGSDGQVSAAPGVTKEAVAGGLTKLTFPQGEVIVGGAKGIDIKVPHLKYQGKVGGLCGKDDPDSPFVDAQGNTVDLPRTIWYSSPQQVEYQQKFADTFLIQEPDRLFDEAECPGGSVSSPQEPQKEFEGCDPATIMEQAMRQCPAGRFYEECVLDAKLTCEVNAEEYELATQAINDLQPTTAPPHPNPGPTVWNEVPGMRCNNSDYKIWVNQEPGENRNAYPVSLEDCKTSCEKNEKCGAINWRGSTDGTAQTCFHIEKPYLTGPDNTCEATREWDNAMAKFGAKGSIYYQA